CLTPDFLVLSFRGDVEKPRLAPTRLGRVRPDQLLVSAHSRVVRHGEPAACVRVLAVHGHRSRPFWGQTLRDKSADDTPPAPTYAQWPQSPAAAHDVPAYCGRTHQRRCRSVRPLGPPSGMPALRGS